jgi:hypothetical protein
MILSFADYPPGKSFFVSVFFLTAIPLIALWFILAQFLVFGALSAGPA